MKKLTYNKKGITVLDENFVPEQIPWSDFELLVAQKKEEFFKETIFIDCILSSGLRYTFKFQCDTKDPIDDLLDFEKTIIQSLKWVTTDWVSKALGLYLNKGEIIIWTRKDLSNGKKIFETIYVEDWDAAKKIAKFNRGHAFRGQPKVNWSLSTSFERAYDKANPREGRGINPPKKWNEEMMIYEFKRKVFLYESNLPSESNTFEWLALMQHYGCPTRLLDFTWSFYVAAFFAIQGADKTQDIAIWCIKPMRFNEEIEKQLIKIGNNQSLEKNEERSSVLNKILNKDDDFNGIMLLEPYKLNERISSQQGLFAVPLNLSLSFIGNLMSSVGFEASESLFESVLTNNFKEFTYSDDAVSLSLDSVLHKIIIPANELYEIRRDLQRMNITHETLFSGLEGYSKSLENKLYPS